MTTHPCITIVTDPLFLKHDTGGGEHPEVPERLQVIDNHLQSCSVAHLLKYDKPIPAAREWLLTYHTEAWLFRFEEAVLSGRAFIDHPYNQVGFEVYAPVADPDEKS